MTGSLHFWNPSELASEMDEMPADDCATLHGGESTSTAGARCTHCGAVRHLRDDPARRICALFGATAGGISGGIKALEVARSCAHGIGDSRVRWTALASAFLLGVLAGATTGCAAGAALGHRLSTYVMTDVLCKVRRREFST